MSEAMARFSSELGVENPGITRKALAMLVSNPWPGNIRELENLIERAYILETTSTLTPDSFPSELFENTLPASAVAVDTGL